MVSQADILGSANKLGFSNKLTSATFASITFEPSIGIAAGRIDKLGLDIRSFHEPLKRAVKEVMIPSIATNFALGGRPAWEPLSAGTLEVRRNWGLTHTEPLLWTQKLYRTAQQQNIWSISRDSAIINDLPSRAWYGKIHQAGYSGSGGMGMNKQGEITGHGRPVAAIPARPFLVIQPEDRTAITVVFAKWLDERVAKASWGRAGGALA